MSRHQARRTELLPGYIYDPFAIARLGGVDVERLTGPGRRSLPSLLREKLQRRPSA